MPTHHQKQKRRWYDGIGEMAMAVHISQQLPPQIQLLIAERLNTVIDGYRKQTLVERQTPSIGSQRILNLYQAYAHRSRWYDLSPPMRRALAMMVGVPETFLSEFANRVLQVGQVLDREQSAYAGVYDASFKNTSRENAPVEEIIRLPDGGMRLGFRGTSFHTPATSFNYRPGKHIRQP